MLWIAAPLTGLIVQPIVGYLSDRTWTRLGRRRPYFLVGAVLAIAGIVRDAELAGAVGRGRPAVGAGCVDQHLDGAVPRLRRRPAAAARSARPATRCRASSSASARWSRACCRGCWRRLGVANTAGPGDDSGHRALCVLFRRRGAARRDAAGRCCARANIRPSSWRRSTMRIRRRRAAARAAARPCGAATGMAASSACWRCSAIRAFGAGQAVVRPGRRASPSTALRCWCAALTSRGGMFAAHHATTCTTCRPRCASSRWCSSSRGSRCSRCGSTPRPR